MYETGNRKLERFLSTITEVGEREANEIRDEIEKRREAFKSAAENEILYELFGYVRRRVAQIRAEAGMRITEEELAGKRKIFENRDKLVEGVILDVERKLEAYTKTDAYLETLSASLAYGKRVIESDAPILCLREADIALAGRLQGGEGLSVKVAPDIRLGGLMLENPERHSRFDMSFDSALIDAKADFIVRSVFGNSVSAEGAAD